MVYQKVSKHKIISFLISAGVLVLFYVLDPQARDFSSFNKNIQRTIAINSCTQGSSTSKVLSVIDGDTIEALTSSCGIEHVRLIGINTPETVDPRRPVECFGHEASDYAKKILTDQTIIIEEDPVAGERDKYGRLLGYIFLTDGTNFNEQIVKDRYAYEYTYNGQQYKYQQEFKAAEAEAKVEKKGLWSDETCAGKK